VSAWLSETPGNIGSISCPANQSSLAFYSRHVMSIWPIMIAHFRSWYNDMHYYVQSWDGTRKTHARIGISVGQPSSWTSKTSNFSWSSWAVYSITAVLPIPGAVYSSRFLNLIKKSCQQNHKTFKRKPWKKLHFSIAWHYTWRKWQKEILSVSH